MKQYKITKKIEDHLKSVKNFEFLLDNFKNTITKRTNNDVFSQMIFTIIGQQISFKVAESIKNKLISTKLINSPEMFLRATTEDIMAFGLIRQRAIYCQNFAKWCIENKDKARYDYLSKLSMDELSELLTPIKGIGDWTIKIFAMMCLENHNVTSFDDLAIRKGLEWLWNSKDTKKDFKVFEKEASPYLTHASFLLNKITEYKLFVYPSFDDYSDYYYDVVNFFGKRYLIKATNYELIFIKEFNGKITKKSNQITNDVITWLNDYKNGKKTKFKHRIRLPYNIKTKNVYLQLMSVNYGDKISYKDLASIAGMERASRRVGTIMKTNNVPFIIPCHRVIKSNGDIGNYLMGMETKIALLKHEGGL